MQKILLSTWGGRGDVEPLIALAERLKAFGADVLIATSPDEDFVQRCDAIGVELIGVGPTTKELTQAPPGTHSIPETADRIIGEQFGVLPAVMAACDVVVATGALPAAAGALSVAEHVGTRAVSVTFQQLTVPSPVRRPLAYPGRELPQDADVAALWDHDAAVIEELFGEALGRHREAAGMARVPVRDHVVTAQPWVASDPVLDPWDGDPALDVVQTGAWSTADATPLSQEVIAFLDDGPPPVYVGFGSMPLHGVEDPASIVLEAVRKVGRRIVLLRGWAGLEAGGDDVCVVGNVNHQALLPRMAAVVHHGGAGTTFAATRSGSPQVVVPQAVDQPYWAGRVAALGVGVAHDGPAPTVESLSAALTRVLTPQRRSRASGVAGRVRTDGTTAAAHLLLS